MRDYVSIRVACRILIETNRSSDKEAIAILADLFAADISTIERTIQYVISITGKRKGR